MKLGLDLAGGVHFLLEVDMEKAIEARMNVYDSELRSLFRTQRLINSKYNEFQITTTRRDNMDVLRLALTDAKQSEIRNYAVSQNLTTVRNRVNELGVAEPLVQRQGANRIIVELPGVQDTAEA